MAKAVKRAAALAMACILILAITACGAAAAKITINDAGTKTEVEAKIGDKITDILKEAGITLGDKDETEPTKDSELKEDVTEITVKRYAKVTVIKGSDKKEVELVGGTVEDALKKAGITLADGESVDVDLKSYLKDSMTITVTAATTVNLTVDGKTTDVATKAATVKEFLEEQKITLGENDEMSEKPETAVTSGMKLVIKRVEYKEEKITEKIDYSTEERESSSMDAGTSEVTQEGVEGEKEVTYKVKYVDGKEASREQVSEKVTKEPVTKIVTKGTKVAQQEVAEQPQQSQQQQSQGRTVVSKENFPDCNGSGHGYYLITYDEGTTEVVEY